MTLHKPGHEPGLNAFVVLRDLHRRGHPAGLIGADRNYNNAEPHKLQLPARALGYGWLFDYRDDQLGIQTTSGNGALQVEGSWYCPSMPLKLIRATELYRAPARAPPPPPRRTPARSAQRPPGLQPALLGQHVAAVRGPPQLADRLRRGERGEDRQQPDSEPDDVRDIHPDLLPLEEDRARFCHSGHHRR